MALYTYSDVVDALLDYIGNAAGDGSDLAFVRRAASEALSDVTKVKNWNFYKVDGRIVTQAPYSTGTITYVSATRTVTLSGGTFPSWANLGRLLIGNVSFKVDSNPTNTTLVLNSQSANLQGDISTPTTYTLYQNVYPLPSDFRCFIGDIIDANTKLFLREVTFNRAFWDTHWLLTPTQPWMYAIIGSPSYENTCSIILSAPPDIVRTFDFPYQRAPRRLLTAAYTTGNITTSGTTVSGNANATFGPSMVGCVLRPSPNSSPVTGRFGGNPFLEERVVVAVPSSTTLTIDVPFANTYSNAPYILSDPIDIDNKVMDTAFMRCAEALIATRRRTSDRAAAVAAYNAALEMALAADSKYQGEQRSAKGGAMDLPFRMLTIGSLGSDVGNNGMGGNYG